MKGRKRDKAGKRKGKKSAIYKCSDGKDAGEKIGIIGADCVIDVEVHDKKEIWWVVVVALVYRVHISDVGAHEPSNCDIWSFSYEAKTTASLLYTYAQQTPVVQLRYHLYLLFR